MSDFVELGRTVDHFLTAESHRLHATEPGVHNLVDESQPLNHAYYLRHRVETVKRIWMTSQTDALALAVMVEEDYESARIWSKYLTQELSHDQLYLRDLAKHGYSREKVASIPTFHSTRAMVEYLKVAVAQLGSMPAVTYSVWVEWNSDKASSLVVKRAAKAFTKGHVRGAHAHTRIDVNEDHYASMLKVVSRLIGKGVDEMEFFRVLSNLTDFFIGYFGELGEAVA
jgi:hypothetical protein